MSESRPTGRSGRGILVTRNRRDCALRFDFATGLSAGTSRNRIMVSSPSPAWSLGSGWTERPGLALLIWKKQTMPGGRERGLVTAQHLFRVISICGSALRSARRPHPIKNERHSASLTNFCLCSCQHSWESKDLAPLAAAGRED